MEQRNFKSKIDVLKIDRCFINRLCDTPDEQSLVNSILLLASGLGLETVAEGVELPEQRNAIARLGCDLIQGFLYSKPVPASHIPEVITQIHTRPHDSAEMSSAA